MVLLDCPEEAPLEELALPHDEVHLWVAALDQIGRQVRRFTCMLSDDERLRASRFHFEPDRQHFIAGRSLLRLILGAYLGVAPSRLEFCYGEYGKPALAAAFGGNELQFNLSHSRGLALYALSRGRRIGVDVEYVRAIPEAEQITRHLFSTRERAAFLSLPLAQRTIAFLNCWTRKEAYVKACGDGLGQGVGHIEVSLAPGEPAQLLAIDRDPRLAARWSLLKLTPAAGYVAALAAEGQGWQLKSRLQQSEPRSLGSQFLHLPLVDEY